MFKKRLFHLLIVTTVVIVAAFAVREAVAEAKIMSQGEATLDAKNSLCELAFPLFPPHRNCNEDGYAFGRYRRWPDRV